MPEELLDHLVYATPDLYATVRELAGLLGAEPAEGGRHVGLGTRNYLLGLGGRRYLEIIGPDPDQPDPGLARPFGLDLLPGPRLVTWAIHPADLDAAVVRARERGYEPGDVHPMSRRTPEELLEWRLTSSPGDTGDGLVPFLIDWRATTHPAERGLPVVELTSLTALHPDPATVAANLAALGVELEVAAGDEPRLVAVVGGIRLS